MGMRYFKGDDNYRPPSNNPDPSKWKLLQWSEIGNYTILKVKYFGCTNFEGMKILLYKGIGYLELTEGTFLDPHFDANGGVRSPIARFEPTHEGWLNAQSLAILSSASETLEQRKLHLLSTNVEDAGRLAGD